MKSYCLLPRAFSHFLNFANIAEQYHVVRSRRQAEFDPDANSPNPLVHLFKSLKIKIFRRKNCSSKFVILRLNWYLRRIQQK